VLNLSPTETRFHHMSHLTRHGTALTCTSDACGIRQAMRARTPSSAHSAHHRHTHTVATQFSIATGTAACRTPPRIMVHRSMPHSLQAASSSHTSAPPLGPATPPLDLHSRILRIQLSTPAARTARPCPKLVPPALLARPSSLMEIKTQTPHRNRVHPGGSTARAASIRT